MVKGQGKNRGKWKIGVTDELHMAKNNLICTARVQVGNKFIKRPMQLLFQLELQCK